MSTAPGFSDWAKDVPTSTRKISFAAYATMAAFAAVFAIWGFSAPLDGAAVAQGVIAAAGKNLEIKHLEGGNVEEVLVREGDRVKAGAALYRLDPTVPQSQLNRLRKAKLSFEARASRLEAERNGAAELAFPPHLLQSADPELVQVLNDQSNDFNSGRRRYESELGIISQRIAALDESIVGLQSQKKAADDQFAIVAGEIERKQKLLEQGLTDRSQFTALQRNQAELLGQIGSVTAEIARARTQIAEAKQQTERTTTQRIEQASKELTEARRQQTDYEEQIIASQSVLTRMVVTAPVDGIVVRINVNSKGSVVRPGEVLLELLPTTDDLIVEAAFDPRHVDSIRSGQSARLRFTALNTRSTPEVGAVVTFVSPDRLVNQNNGLSYYTVRLRIETLPPEVSPDQIYPGMPVEAYISTGDRTFAEYLARPILDAASRAFRED